MLEYGTVRHENAGYEISAKLAFNPQNEATVTYALIDYSRRYEITDNCRIWCSKETGDFCPQDPTLPNPQDFRELRNGGTANIFIPLTQKLSLIHI